MQAPKKDYFSVRGTGGNRPFRFKQLRALIFQGFSAPAEEGLTSVKSKGYTQDQQNRGTRRGLEGPKSKGLPQGLWPLAGPAYDPR
jgi:hypothetical protein